MSCPLPLARLRAVLAVSLSLGSFAGLLGCGSGSVSQIPINILTQPVSATVTAGQSATFNVVATGAGTLHYQWMDGTALIPGANASTYTVGQTTVSQSGSTYGVVVSEGDQTVTGGPATLTVMPLASGLQVTVPPAQVYGGGAVTLAAQSQSSAPIAFGLVSGPATLSGNMVTPTGVGTVVVQAVQPAAGNFAATTVTGSFTVTPAIPALSFAPVAAKTFGDPSFAVSASSASTGPVTYSVVSGPATVAGNTVSLNGAGTVSLRATQAASGNYGSATANISIPVGLTIVMSPISPAGVTLAPGQQSFTTTVTGGPTDAVTWSASAGSITAQGAWTSPTSPGTYTITATSVEDPSKTVSTTATVSAPVLTAQPASRNLCPGSPLTLTVAAQYAASFQWYRNGSAIGGATAATYSVPAAGAGDGGSYNVVASSPAGAVGSAMASVNVGSTLTGQPQAATVLQPATATFAVAAQGQAPFSYQWYSQAPGATAGSALQGAVAATYTTSATDYSLNGDAFYAVVTDACGVALTSSAAALTVNSLPVITQQPATQPVAPGSAVQLNVAATGTPSLSYQWFYQPAGLKHGTLIPGATAAGYTVPATVTTASNNGDSYYVTVTNTYGNVSSQQAVMQTGGASGSLWVVGWGASPENALSGSENPGGQEQSFRFFLNPTVSGTTERVHLSNLFGKTPITVGAARLAAAAGSNGVNGNAIDSTKDFALTFQGATSITLQPGQEITSDPVQITYTLGQKLAVTMYVQGTFPALTQHESQVNVNYATPAGAGNTTTDASGGSFTQANTEWYLLTGVDVYGPYQGTVAVFGSSSIDGHASNYGDTNSYPVANVPVPGQDADRPSDWLGRQLTAAGYNLGVLNAGTIGDPAGRDARTASGSVIAGIDRIPHDVLDQPGIKAVVIYFGGVDIRGDCVPATNVEVSLTSMVTQAQAAGVRVILATLPPSEYCTTQQPLPYTANPYSGDLFPGPENPGSTQRRALNDWIRTTGSTLPGVVAIADFDAVLLDPAHPDFMKANLNSGDNFHPNGTGYGVQSSAIPLGALLGP